MKYFQYLWYRYMLHTACQQCGNRIPYQGENGHPVCNDCGHKAPFTWTEVLKYAEIEELRKKNTGTKKFLGTMDMSLITEPAQINCYHCQHPLPPIENTEATHINCPSCQQDIAFSPIEGIEDMALYRYKKSNGEKPAALVAVRCVSCGAPLEADPTKPHYTCRFCSTENVLPPAMRYKLVLDDIYIGVKNVRYPKQVAFEKNGDIAKRSIRENGLQAFTHEELNQLLVMYKNDAGFYNLVVNEKGFPSDPATLQELFATTTNQGVVQNTAKKLGKSAEETEKRIVEVNPQYLANKKSAQEQMKKQKQSSGNAKKRRTNLYILIAVALIIIYFIISYLTNNPWAQ